MVQLKNDRVVSNLESQFQRTGDASFATESLIGNYLTLPGLMGFWPMSSMGASGQARDISGNSLTLTNSGVQFTYISSIKNIPAAFFAPASSDRFYAADAAGFYSSFTSTYVSSAYRGLTAGAWVRWANLGAANECIIGQWDSGASDKQWMIYSNTSSQIGGYFSNDGSTNQSEVISSSQHGVSSNEWHFICVQVSPSTYNDFVRTWVDDYYEESAHGQTALNDSGANFGIAHNYNSGSPTNYFEGYVSMAFLCGMNIGDTNIRRLYYRTRAAFQHRGLW